VNIRTLTTVAASLVVISGIVTINLWSELGSQREVTASLNTELSESQGRIKAAEDELVAAAARVAATPSAPAPASAPAPEKKPTSTSALPSPLAAGVVVFSSGNGSTVSISQQDLMKDPEYRKARLMMTRATIGQNYPGVAEELGLNPEEADQLFDLLAQNQMDQSAQLTLVLNGTQPDQAAMAEANRKRQVLQRELNDSLQNMLGDARYSQWQDYQRTQGQRVQANSYATQLAQAGVPMSASQNKALVDVLIAEQRTLQTDTVQLGRMVDPSNPATRAEAQRALSERRARSNQHILDAAAGTLTPQQINVLREQFAQQEAINAAQDRVRERTQGMAQGVTVF